MDNFKKLGMEILGPVHVKDPASKSNQIYYLRESLLNRVALYARMNGLTEQQFETAFHESLSILEGIYSALEPFRKCSGDDGDVWHHQYINVDYLLGRKKDFKQPVYSTNGLFEEYVDAYIDQQAMHSKELTGLLLDVHYYNETMDLIYKVKADSRLKNIIKPSMPYLLTTMVLQLSGYAIAIFIGAVIHKNGPEFLTPYVLVYLYWRYKLMRSEPSKTLTKEFFEYSLGRYNFPNGKYNFEQQITELRTAHEKYGLRHSATIFALVQLLK